MGASSFLKIWKEQNRDLHQLAEYIFQTSAAAVVRDLEDDGNLADDDQCVRKVTQ